MRFSSFLKKEQISMRNGPHRNHAHRHFVCRRMHQCTDVVI